MPSITLGGGSNRIPIRVNAIGDGSYSLSTRDAALAGGGAAVPIVLDPTNPLPIRVYALGDGTYALSTRTVSPALGLDATIALDRADPLPIRVFNNGDGTYSLAVHPEP
jgi:hypothetical protein